jgi:PilZ domain
MPATVQEKRAKMETANNPEASMREIQAGLERLERREWWRWAVALIIVLLLTFAVFSLSLPGLRKDAFTGVQLDLAVRGLFGLVLIFDFFAIYQQVLISRLRRQLAGQIGMLATLEAMRPAATDNATRWKERRRSPRYAFDQRLKVKAMVKSKETVFFGRIIDIGEFGLAAVLSGSLERDEKAVLEFSPPEGHKMLTLPAITRYANGFRHGFEFSSLSATQWEEVRQVCATAQGGLVAHK